MDTSSWFLTVGRKMTVYGSFLTLLWGWMVCVSPIPILWAAGVPAVAAASDGPSSGAVSGSVPRAAMDVRGGSVDGYGVTGVEVDSQNQPVQTAKEQAIFVAYRHAFRLLIDHMTGGTAPDVVLMAEQVTDDDLERLVRDFELEWEKQSAFSYKASFLVRFKESAVRTYLDQDLSKNLGQQVAYAAPKTSVILLPIHRVGDVHTLWEDGNPWFAFLNTLDGFDEKAFVLPLGDLQDRSLMPPLDAIPGNEALNPIMDRYGVDRAIIARLDGGDGSIQDGTLRLFYVIKNQGVVLVETKAIPAKGGQSPYQGAYDVLKESYGRFLKDGQKSQEKQSLSAVVSFDDLEAWHQIQNRLMALPLVKDMIVETLSPRSAHVQIVHRGDRGALLELAEEMGITFAPVGTGWVVEQSDPNVGQAF